MNQRIFELAEEALEETHRVMGSTCLQEAFDDFYTEKFAELIVRECIGILEKEIAGKSETVVYNQDEWDKKNLHFTLLTNMVLETKEHFGVEQ